MAQKNKPVPKKVDPKKNRPGKDHDDDDNGNGNEPEEAPPKPDEDIPQLPVEGPAKPEPPSEEEPPQEEPAAEEETKELPTNDLWEPKDFRELTKWYVDQIEFGAATRREYLKHAKKLLKKAD